MKKTIISAAILLGTVSAASAQQAIATPKFGDNWSLGINGGITTPMNHSHFFRDARAVVGLKLDKKISPIYKVGIEGDFAINTSTVRGPHSYTAFDDSYVGAYGAVNLFNLFGGYPGKVRPIDIDAVLGAGWGHRFETETHDYNYFGTKTGLNINFNVNDYLTITVQPSIIWNMTSNPTRNSSAAYNKNEANYNITAGVAYNFGGNGFKVVEPYNQAQIDELNGQLNELRGALDASNAQNRALKAQAKGMEEEIVKLQNKPAKVVNTVQVKNNLESVRYVFFRIGSSAIGADQQPNVEMIAAYLNNHPNSKVIIKGYASKDGPEEVNIRLANQRAQSVKDALMKRYKIPASRIVAEGEGIGNMFEEESWNRVAICILETK